jgi:hypothetical protein
MTETGYASFRPLTGWDNLFENHSENSSKEDLSKNTTVNPRLFSQWSIPLTPYRKAAVFMQSTVIKTKLLRIGCENFDLQERA